MGAGTTVSGVVGSDNRYVGSTTLELSKYFLHYESLAGGCMWRY